jgi:hypothetical protein
MYMVHSGSVQVSDGGGALCRQFTGIGAARHRCKGVDAHFFSSGLTMRTVKVRVHARHRHAP